MNKNIKNALKSKKSILSAALVIAATATASAQGNGSCRHHGSHLDGEFVFLNPATKLIYAIGAVIGLIGGVKVYSKFSSGDPDTSKTAAAGSVRVSSLS